MHFTVLTRCKNSCHVTLKLKGSVKEPNKFHIYEWNWENHSQSQWCGRIYRFVRFFHPRSSCTTHLMLFSERLPIYASSCMTISGERTEQLDIFGHVTLALWVIFIRHKRPQMVTWQFLDRQFLDHHSNPNPDPNPDPDPNPNLTLFLTQSRNWRSRNWWSRKWRDTSADTWVGHDDLGWNLFIIILNTEAIR